MNFDDTIYRSSSGTSISRRSLPVGRVRADIRLLKRLFTPEEAGWRSI